MTAEGSGRERRELRRVRDQNARGMVQQPAGPPKQGVENETTGGCVDCREDVIKKECRWLGVGRTRERDTLLLPAAYGDTALADDGTVRVRE